MERQVLIFNAVTTSAFIFAIFLVTPALSIKCFGNLSDYTNNVTDANECTKTNATMCQYVVSIAANLTVTSGVGQCVIENDANCPNNCTVANEMGRVCTGCCPPGNAMEIKECIVGKVAGYTGGANNQLGSPTMALVLSIGVAVVTYYMH